MKKGCYINGKFFLKQDAELIKKITPKELRDNIIEIWPRIETSKITDNQLKEIIMTKVKLDKSFRVWLYFELLKSPGNLNT